MQELLDEFTPGTSIYLPGATGEIVALTRALQLDPQRMRGVTIISCLIPGINEFDYAALDRDARLITFMLPRALRASFESGRVEVLSIAYRAVAAYLREAARIDVAVAHLSQPDASGLCSFGIAADFSPIAWRAARRKIAVINTAMPHMRRGPKVALQDANLVVACQSPLIEVVAKQEPSGPVDRIAKHAAVLIPDGATLQFGIGNAPRALCRYLSHHRDLRMRSGMVPCELQGLAAAGALADPTVHRAGIAAGGCAFYRYLSESDLIAFDDTQVTHDSAALSAIDRYHALNSALQIDLFGQVNLEWQQGQLVGGVGGALDFARAASASRNGRSIILMPSTARGAMVSRIVPRLSVPAVSMARTDIDTVVTEHGIAELRNLSLDERAAALIRIAAEAHRDHLGRAWREIRTSL